VDVVNFDAYEYFQGLSLYPAEVNAFLARGGILSWGIVPASRGVDGLDARDLLEKLDSRIQQLEAKGIDDGRLRRQALLTPSCGLGTETFEMAERRVDALVELSSLLRERGRPS